MEQLKNTHITDIDKTFGRLGDHDPSEIAHRWVQDGCSIDEVYRILKADPTLFRPIFSITGSILASRSRQPPIDDVTFCFWFVGLFDGEGSFKLQKSPIKELQVQIDMRIDDAAVLHHIAARLGGELYYQPPDPRCHKFPRGIWRVTQLPLLANVLVPVFDQYPLFSKKRKEYKIWRDLVIERTGPWEKKFDAAVETFDLIRHPWLWCSRDYGTAKRRSKDLVVAK